MYEFADFFFPPSGPVGNLISLFNKHCIEVYIQPFGASRDKWLILT